MKLLLCSDFSGVGYRYLKKFYKSGKGMNCLFVGYACEEDSEMFESGSKDYLSNFGFNVINLTPDYSFNDKIHAVFVRGGNTTKLIDYLRKYNQFDKLKNLVEENDLLYIGNSAGSVLVGSDTEWTLRSEPYKDIKKLYGNNALKGFGWINKLIFVHASKYRICFSFERETPDDIFRTLDKECYPAYVEDKKIYNKNEYIKIANNEVNYVNGEDKKILTYNWNNIKIKV